VIMALFRGFVLQRLIRAASNPRNQERAKQAYRSMRSGSSGGGSTGHRR
jgi:hypothetical protein